MGKRIKREVAVYTLPRQVVELIITYAGRKGLIELSSTNKNYRQEMSPYVFSQVKTIWHNFEVDWFQEFLLSKRQWIQQFRIVDCYSYGEWQTDIFSLVLNKLPYLRVFIINSYNSTNWFKYRHNDTIKCLNMYYDFTHNETEQVYQNPNPKKIRRLSRSSNLPRIFNLNHLNNFKLLTNITLNDFHFNWDESEHINFLHLRFLSLTNCTWEYPFSLVKFNENNSLISLDLKYSNNNAFILSERFSNFLEHPLQKQSHIEKLAVVCGNCRIQRYLSVNQVKIFLDPDNFPHLMELDLRGWVIDSKTFQGYVDTLGSRYKRPINVRLEADHTQVQV